ncbi:hypothetical protein BC834DRAFT_974362 [Gloeopeniophorella convolvens]|nr:hypothetical protein BC834DRAFT_974362 [Gloeopeniophorella convolvens]
MAPEAPLVEIVHFTATDECLADPSLFAALRDAAEAWREHGLTAQYWGASVQRANELYWLLLWRSEAHETAATPALAALARTPPTSLHVRFTGNPHRCLTAPVSELDVYRTVDGPGVHETHEAVRRNAHRVESLQMRGFIALSWGVAREDPRTGIYLAGWRSIEDHMRLGTLDDHKVFLKEAEAIFAQFSGLSVMHVRFARHGGS